MEGAGPAHHLVADGAAPPARTVAATDRGQRAAEVAAEPSSHWASAERACARRRRGCGLVVGARCNGGRGQGAIRFCPDAPSSGRYSLSTRQGWVNTTRLMAILSFSNRCKLMRSEGHLEYPFQSKTLATRGASEGKVVDLSYPAKGR